MNNQYENDEIFEQDVIDYRQRRKENRIITSIVAILVISPIVILIISISILYRTSILYKNIKESENKILLQVEVNNENISEVQRIINDKSKNITESLNEVKTTEGENNVYALSDEDVSKIATEIINQLCSELAKYKALSSTINDKKGSDNQRDDVSENIKDSYNNVLDVQSELLIDVLRAIAEFD